MATTLPVVTGKRNTGMKPGHAKMGGRVKGTSNKSTVLLKEAILLAAEAVGQDGKGKEGLLGYLKMAAVSQPKAFITLLGRLLPTTLANDPDNPLKMVDGALEVRFVKSDEGP